MIRLTVALLLPLMIFADDTPKKNKNVPTPVGLDKYTAEAARQAMSATPSPGAIWTPIAQFADVARDLKASQVNDLVTIIVAESASAVTSGATQTSRKSSASSSITALGGLKSATG